MNTSTPWMMFGMQIFQSFSGHMRVDGGGRDIGMA
jgi:hypothetical protein